MKRRPALPMRRPSIDAHAQGKRRRISQLVEAPRSHACGTRLAGQNSTKPVSASMPCQRLHPTGHRSVVIVHRSRHIPDCRGPGFRLPNARRQTRLLPAGGHTISPPLVSCHSTFTRYAVNSQFIQDMGLRPRILKGGPVHRRRERRWRIRRTCLVSGGSAQTGSSRATDQITGHGPCLDSSYFVLEIDIIKIDRRHFCRQCRQMSRPTGAPHPGSMPPPPRTTYHRSPSLFGRRAGKRAFSP